MIGWFVGLFYKEYVTLPVCQDTCFTDLILWDHLKAKAEKERKSER